MEATIIYDPHHIISDRRQTNRNNPFKHDEVERLVEKENWMEYPGETSCDEDMPKNSTSSTPTGNSPQQDLSSIIATTTQITHLDSVSEKGNKREFP